MTREEYAAYLASPQWEHLRAMVWSRERGRCQGCGFAICGEGHVHHTTYDRVGAELLCDLLLLCPGCHRRIHGQAEPSSRLVELDDDRGINAASVEEQDAWLLERDREARGRAWARRVG